MNIICRKTKCRFNNNYNCTAKEIFVNKNIICSTYVTDDEKKDLSESSRQIFDEEPPKYSSHRVSKFGCIGCNANCLFNNNSVCDANGITVNSLQHKPFCVTYLKK